MAESDTIQIGAMIGGSFKCCMCDTKHMKLEGQQNVSRCWEKMRELIFQSHCEWGSHGTPGSEEVIELSGKITDIIDIVCTDKMKTMPADFKYLLAARTRDDALRQFDEIYFKKIDELKEYVRHKLINKDARVRTQFQIPEKEDDDDYRSGAIKVGKEWMNPTWKDWDLLLGDERMAQEAMGLAFRGVPLDIRPISAGYRGAVLYCVKKQNWIKAFSSYSRESEPYQHRIETEEDANGKSKKKKVDQRHVDHLEDVLITSGGIFRCTRKLDTIKDAERALRLTGAPVDAILPGEKRTGGAVEAVPGSYFGDAWLPPAKGVPVVPRSDTPVQAAVVE